MLPALAILGIAETVLRIIENEQKLLLIATPEIREARLRRLDKWESFWEKLVDPFVKLITKDSE